MYQGDSYDFDHILFESIHYLYLKIKSLYCEDIYRLICNLYALQANASIIGICGLL